MRILLVEDESRVAKRIERMTRSFFGNKLQKVLLCEGLPEARQLMQQQPFDLVLLDLNLNGEDGFELLQETASAAFHTIIISAYKDKAITAFEYGVLDFVPKPFNEERLAQAFLRISSTQKAGIGARYLSVKKRGAITLIDVSDICYIQGAGIYTELHLKNRRKEIHDKSLEKLEQLLPPNFVRIHKSYIADMLEAQEILVETGSKYSLLLSTGQRLPIGRTRYKTLKEDFFNG